MSADRIPAAASSPTSERDARFDPIQRLILELGRLPGVGERSAARLAYYIINKSCRGRCSAESTMAEDLAQALLTVRREVGMCQRCQNLCAGSLCRLCSDGRRDTSVLCVVEEVGDLRAIEASGAYRGLYHVLHGALSPLDGIGPDQLQLQLVVERVQADGIQEVILATNANVDGDATALYLSRLLQGTSASVTRLASGVPLGGELEYLDAATLGRALADRRTF